MIHPSQNSSDPALGNVLVAEPRGFCAGVERAIEIVEQALHVHGAPVYVRKEIVHNHHVVEDLRKRGVHFVDSEHEVPTGAVCVFSAHGISPQVRATAAERGLRVIDATCPLVSKVHQEAKRFVAQGRTVLLVGHAEHEEIEGVRGEAPDRIVVVESVEDVVKLDLPRDAPVSYLTQTTLSLDETAEIVDALHARFSTLSGPRKDDICYASQNRQNAVKEIAARSDLVLVVGSRNSSNSVRMVEVARAAGARAELVPDVGELSEDWLDGVRTVGVSAGASAPEHLVQQLVERLTAFGYGNRETTGTVVENVVFHLPPGLARRPAPAGTGEEGGEAR